MKVSSHKSRGWKSESVELKEILRARTLVVQVSGMACRIKLLYMICDLSKVGDDLKVLPDRLQTSALPTATRPSFLLDLRSRVMRGFLGVLFLLVAALGFGQDTGGILGFGSPGYGESASSNERIIQVAAGDHAVALRSDGSIVCWGRDLGGCCQVPAGLTGAVKVAAGTGTTLALKADGGLVFWGDNDLGQGAIPTGLTGVVQVSSRDAHTIALKSNGRVVCWGSNSHGESTVPANLSGVVQVDAGGDHSVALKSNGKVVCWGDNDNNECDVPAGLTDVVQVVAGYTYTAALKKDGTVVSWGWFPVPSGLKGVLKLSAGERHVVALKSDGTVVCWGDNEFGDCNVPPGLTGVVQVVGGDAQTLALKADGNMLAWGISTSTIPTGLRGTIQVASGSDYMVALKSDWTVVSIGGSTVPAGLKGVVQVASSDNHSVALKSDGTVVCWGDNSYGMSTVPPGLSGVVQVAAGPDRTVGLKSDGSIVSWGGFPLLSGVTGFTQVAGGKGFILALKVDGSVTSWGDAFGTPPVGLSGVVQLAAGYFHSVALKSDGSVVCWGNNDFGQCNVPAGLSNVVKVAASDYSTVAIKSDGSLVRWGKDSDIYAVPMGFTGVVQVAAWGDRTVAVKAVGAYSDLVDVVVGQASVGHLTLTLPVAPKTTATVTLQSDSASVHVPTSVPFLAGQHSQTVPVTIGAGIKAGVYKIRASYLGADALVSFGASRLSLSPMSLTRKTVLGGAALQGSFKFSHSAPGSGYLVTLASSEPNVIVPPSVTVTAGQDQATFPISTKTVPVNIGSRITASTEGLQSQAILAVRAILMSVNPTVVQGGSTSMGKVLLSQRAPIGGRVVSLASDNLVVQVPASVTVPEGAIEATFSVTTTNSTTALATINGNYGPNARAETRLLVNPILPFSGFSIAPATIGSGGTATGAVRLQSPAGPSGVVIAVRSDDRFALVPATVTVPAGASVVTFPIRESGSTADYSPTITVTSGTVSLTHRFTISLALPMISSFVVTPATAKGGTTVNGTITLTKPAPTGGAVVSVTSDDPSAQVPSTVMIAAGQTSVSFAISTNTVTSSKTPNITATINGSTETAPLKLNP